MFGWLRPAPGSPVSEEERIWIESRFNWLTDEFGVERLLNAPLILPTSEYFPTSYRGEESEIQNLLELVAKYMDIDPARLLLRFYEDEKPLFEAQRHGTTGFYSESTHFLKIWLETSRLEDPFGVVATLAHEIGHAVLLGQRRVSPAEQDHELLTDLVTVFLGLGIFSANAALHENYWSHGQWSGWSIGRQGYMSMDMYGYAFALYATARSETRPQWASHLRRDVRSAMKKGLRFIQKTEECSYAFPKPESS